MDQLDKDILRELTRNARISMTELGKFVGLSAPSVTERVKKLEEKEIIKGYTTIIDPKKLNKHITAFVLFDTERCKPFEQFCKTYPDIEECHRLAGQYSFLVKVVTEDVSSLERFIDEAMKYGKSSTLITLSSPVPK